MSKIAAQGDARTAILQRIENALSKASHTDAPDATALNTKVFKDEYSDDKLVRFAEAFAGLQGQFAYCLNAREMVEQLQQLLQKKQWSKVYCAEPLLKGQFTALGYNQEFYGDLATCDVAITSVEALVARTGSMVLSSAITKGRTGSAYAPVHIAIAYSAQVVYDIGDAISLLQQRYNGQIPSFISFATGPSRTADIEKTLVTGVHGPGEVFCFVVDSAG